MSQIPFQSCPNCRAPMKPSLGPCPNCGTVLPMRGIPPTVPAQSATPGTPYSPSPMGGLPPTEPAIPPGVAPTSASPYNMTPPPPGPTPADPYSIGTFQFAPPKKKPSPWLYIGAIIAAALVIAVGSSLLIAHSSQGNLSDNSGGNFPASENLSKLSITFASDDITFKSIQQQKTFPDDQQANDNGVYKYFIRLNIHEANNSGGIAEVIYDIDFHLVLPNGSTVPALSSEIALEPQQNENRDNWVDFGLHSGKVDLSKLALVLGNGGEQTMKVPLQSGANLSQYQPKTINPAQHFTYDGMDWELKDATESLSYSGSQAKTGKVYIIVDMVVNNNSQRTFASAGIDFVTLHSGSTSTAPDVSLSSADNLDYIQPGTANVTGTWDFLTPIAPGGQYTLAFAGNDGANGSMPYPSQNVSFTIN